MRNENSIERVGIGRDNDKTTDVNLSVERAGVYVLAARCFRGAEMAADEGSQNTVTTVGHDAAVLWMGLVLWRGVDSVSAPRIL